MTMICKCKWCCHTHTNKQTNLPSSQTLKSLGQKTKIYIFIYIKKSDQLKGVKSVVTICLSLCNLVKSAKICLLCQLLFSLFMKKKHNFLFCFFVKNKILLLLFVIPNFLTFKLMSVWEDEFCFFFFLFVFHFFLLFEKLKEYKLYYFFFFIPVTFTSSYTLHKMYKMFCFVVVL